MALSLGVLVALAHFAVQYQGIRIPFVWMLGGLPAELIVLLTPYVCILIWLCCNTQSWGAVLLAGALIAWPYVPVVFPAWFLVQNDGGARQDWATALIDMGRPMCVSIFAGAGLAALVRQFVRLFVVKLRSHQPNTCTTCGYLLGTDQRITRCPECGAARSEVPVLWTRRPTLCTRLQRVSPWLLAILLGSAGLWVVCRVVWVTLPIRSFDRALADRTNGGGYVSLAVTAGARAPTAVYQLRADKSDVPERRIAYAFAPNPPDGFPAMRIAVAIRPQWQLMDAGIKPVYADLNQEQAELVMRLGSAPEPLRRALLDRADEVGWAPSPFASLVWRSGEAINPGPYLPSEKPK